MADLNPESMQVEKDDRPIASEKRKHAPLSHPFNRRSIILILIIVILLIICSVLIFRSPSTANSQRSGVSPATSASNNTALNSNGMPQNDAQSQALEASAATADNNGQYQNINAPVISREATETQATTPVYKERLEIPGEITDQIVQKLPTTNSATPADAQSKSTSTPLELRSQQTATNAKFNELPLKAQIPATHYTIQLSGSSSLQSLMDFAKKHKVTNYLIYETQRNNKNWFVMIKGDYPTMADAKAALNALPADLKVSKPWVRTGESVRKEKL